MKGFIRILLNNKEIISGENFIHDRFAETLLTRANVSIYISENTTPASANPYKSDILFDGIELPTSKSFDGVNSITYTGTITLNSDFTITSIRLVDTDSDISRSEFVLSSPIRVISGTNVSIIYTVVFNEYPVDYSGNPLEMSSDFLFSIRGLENHSLYWAKLPVDFDLRNIDYATDRFRLLPNYTLPITFNNLAFRYDLGVAEADVSVSKDEILIISDSTSLADPFYVAIPDRANTRYGDFVDDIHQPIRNKVITVKPLDLDFVESATTLQEIIDKEPSMVESPLVVSKYNFDRVSGLPFYIYNFYELMYSTNEYWKARLVFNGEILNFVDSSKHNISAVDVQYKYIKDDFFYEIVGDQIYLEVSTPKINIFSAATKLRRPPNSYIVGGFFYNNYWTGLGGEGLFYTPTNNRKELHYYFLVEEWFFLDIIISTPSDISDIYFVGFYDNDLYIYTQDRKFIFKDFDIYDGSYSSFSDDPFAILDPSEQEFGPSNRGSSPIYIKKDSTSNNLYCSFSYPSSGYPSTKNYVDVQVDIGTYYTDYSMPSQIFDRLFATYVRDISTNEMKVVVSIGPIIDFGGSYSFFYTITPPVSNYTNNFRLGIIYLQDTYDFKSYIVYYQSDSSKLSFYSFSVYLSQNDNTYHRIELGPYTVDLGFNFKILPNYSSYGFFPYIKLLNTDTGELILYRPDLYAKFYDPSTPEDSYRCILLWFDETFSGIPTSSTNLANIHPDFDVWDAPDNWDEPNVAVVFIDEQALDTVNQALAYDSITEIKTSYMNSVIRWYSFYSLDESIIGQLNFDRVAYIEVLDAFLILEEDESSPHIDVLFYSGTGSVSASDPPTFYYDKFTGIVYDHNLQNYFDNWYSLKLKIRSWVRWP